MFSKYSICFLCMCALFISQAYSLEPWTKSPTERYVDSYPLEEIKYSLRLDNVTFENRPLYDKAVEQEAFGFVGYCGASGNFRVYQDLIRMVFEEVLGVSIPPDFHFLAVPLYPQRTVKNLDDIAKAYFEKNSNPYAVVNGLFPMNISLYSSHNRLGYCPLKDFFLGIERNKMEDLYWLFDYLEIDSGIIDQAVAVAKESFGAEFRVLLQFFDNGLESYDFIDTQCYSAWPNGHPFKNQALSDYVCGREFPPQFFLLLDERGVLNPNAPFVIKRHAKVQSSKIKAYEGHVRGLIKAAMFNVEKCDAYRKELKQIWEVK